MAYRREIAPCRTKRSSCGCSPFRSRRCCASPCARNTGSCAAGNPAACANSTTPRPPRASPRSPPLSACCSERSRRPIFELQARHPGEFAFVRGHEQSIVPARLSGEQNVIRSNGRSGLLQRRSDIACLLGVGRFKRQNLDRASEKVGNALQVTLGARALHSAVSELEQHDGRDRKHGSGRDGRVDPRTYRRGAVVEDRNDRIGIETDHSSKKPREAGFAGCCRPSGMKGSSRYSSSFANHAFTSKGAPIGSSSTPCPIRRTRTSVPGMRNSFGRRTAWLRPCLKSLAIPLSPMAFPYRMVAIL